MLKRLIVISIIALVLAAGCTDNSAQSDTMASDFSLQDMSGKTVTLSNYKGKVVLLEFWTTWCPSCRAAVPSLEKLHQVYKDKGLVVLSVSMDFGGLDELKSFIAERGITYAVLKGTEDVAVQYQVRTIPMLLVLNKKGKIEKRNLGMGSYEDMEKDIKAYL